MAMLESRADTVAILDAAAAENVPSVVAGVAGVPGALSVPWMPIAPTPRHKRAAALRLYVQGERLLDEVNPLPPSHHPPPKANSGRNQKQVTNEARFTWPGLAPRRQR